MKVLVKESELALNGKSARMPASVSAHARAHVCECVVRVCVCVCIYICAFVSARARVLRQRLLSIALFVMFTVHFVFREYFFMCFLRGYDALIILTYIRLFVSNCRQTNFHSGITDYIISVHTLFHFPPDVNPILLPFLLLLFCLFLYVFVLAAVFS